jgi:hypothetical protein
MKRTNHRTERRGRIELAAQIGAETVPHEGGEPVVGELTRCTISDLSLGGMRVVVTSHHTMAMTRRVRLYLDIDPSGDPLELSGIVRWRQIEPGSPAQVLGVEFLVPEEKALRRWVEHVDDIIADAPPVDIVGDASDPWPW